MAEHDLKGLAFPRLDEAQMAAMRRCPLTTLAEVLGLCRPLERPRGGICLVTARRIGNRFPASRSARYHLIGRGLARPPRGWAGSRACRGVGEAADRSRLA